MPVYDPAKAQNKQTFTAAEKLKSEKIIEQLFKKGKSVTKNGFTLVYLVTPLHTFYPAQAGFSVPKRNFKNAVDRNRIKRLMREAYRHSKLPLYQKLAAAKKQAAIMWVYKGKEVPDHTLVKESISYCMTKFSSVLGL